MSLHLLSCRFCLSTKETEGESLFCRLPPAVVQDLVRELLCIEVSSTDEFQRLCTECEKRLAQMYQMLCDFRNSDRLFRTLLGEYNLSQKPSKNNIEMVCVQGLDDKSILHAELFGQCQEDEDKAAEPEPLARPVKRERSPSDADEAEEPDFSFVDPPSSPDEVELNSSDDEDADVQIAADDQELGKALIEDGDESDAESVDSSGRHSKKKRSDGLKEQLTCFICSIPQTSEKSLAKHLKEHRAMLPYKCEDCLVLLNDLDDVNQHFRLHAFPLGCLYCEMVFAQQSELDEHKASCNGYRCKKCTRSYATVDAFQVHKCARRIERLKLLNKFFYRNETRQKLKAHHKNCSACEKTFKSNGNLADHLSAIHPYLPIPLFSCDFCSRRWTSLEAARRHRMSHKKASSTQAVSNALVLKVDEQACWVCHGRFDKDSILVKHIEFQHPEHAVSLIQCEICQRKFTTYRKKDDHASRAHQNLQEARYCCTFCGKGFRRLRNLRDHENLHQGLKGYRCEHCPQMFAYKARYFRHLRTQHGQSGRKTAQTYECHHCLQIFRSNSALVEHMKVHNGESSGQYQPNLYPAPPAQYYGAYVPHQYGTYPFNN